MSQSEVGGGRAPSAKINANINKLGLRGLAAASVVAAGFAGVWYGYLRHDDSKQARGQLENWEAAHNPTGGKSPRYRPEDRRTQLPTNPSDEAKVFSNYDKDKKGTS
ncbi:hypothetical protein Moror_10376 [Moniliophthora roreri MCA 2997]|uniref:Uncharacterized protein n=2 Tax=Moniliophthora roreri TaxID=221103 RepID=V2XHF4_MONRO|nr:hypothetical protein Moror_10376 [Moniliophthora roreri MCA 2997]